MQKSGVSKISSYFGQICSMRLKICLACSHSHLEQLRADSIFIMLFCCCYCLKFWLKLLSRLQYANVLCQWSRYAGNDRSVGRRRCRWEDADGGDMRESLPHQELPISVRYGQALSDIGRGREVKKVVDRLRDSASWLPLYTGGRGIELTQPSLYLVRKSPPHLNLMVAAAVTPCCRGRQWKGALSESWTRERERERERVHIGNALTRLEKALHPNAILSTAYIKFIIGGSNISDIRITTCKFSYLSCISHKPGFLYCPNLLVQSQDPTPGTR